MEKPMTNPYGLGPKPAEIANSDGVVNKLPDDKHIAFDVVKEMKISYMCPECGRASSNQFDDVKHEIVIDCIHCSYKKTARVIVDIKPSIKS